MQSVKQEPIYLPGVESNLQPSHYLNLIRTSQSTGKEITVCALFNFYNRWITASGVHAVSDEGHRLHRKVLAQKGHDLQLRERRLGRVGESGE